MDVYVMLFMFFNMNINSTTVWSFFLRMIIMKKTSKCWIWKVTLTSIVKTPRGMKVPFEKPDELMGEGRLEVMGLYMIYN